VNGEVGSEVVERDAATGRVLARGRLVVYDPPEVLAFSIAGVDDLGDGAGTGHLPVVPRG
jgi:hypothetical protein